MVAGARLHAALILVAACLSSHVALSQAAGPDPAALSKTLQQLRNTNLAQRVRAFDAIYDSIAIKA
jgi:hypothetical protein